MLGINGCTRALSLAIVISTIGALSGCLQEEPELPTPAVIHPDNIVIRAFIAPDSGPEEAVIDLLQSLQTQHPEALRVHLFDITDGGQGTAAWHEAELDSVAIMINGNTTVSWGAGDDRRTVNFVHPPGFSWNRDDLREAIEAGLRGELSPAEPEEAEGIRTVEARIPREQYVLRRCGVHYPARTAEGQEAAGAGERWPGAARGWDLAAFPGDRQDRARKRQRSLEILQPADGGQYVLTGEDDGDQLPARSSLDGETDIHWYLNGRYLGKAERQDDVILELEPGEHELTCMTPSGTMRTVNFTVERPERGPLF